MSQRAGNGGPDIPRTRDELFDYHVVLIGDVPPERLGANEEQLNNWLELLVEFVEFGGGVGFMFGDQAMPDRYRGTPLEDAFVTLTGISPDGAWVSYNDPILGNRMRKAGGDYLMTRSFGFNT